MDPVRVESGLLSVGGGESERHTRGGVPISAAEGSPVSARLVSLAPSWYLALGDPSQCSGYFYSCGEECPDRGRGASSHEHNLPPQMER